MRRAARRTGYGVAVAVLAVAAMIDCAGSQEESPPPGADGGPDAADGGMLCGTAGQTCCPNSTCNSGFVCVAGGCEMRGELDAALDVGCGALATCSTGCADLQMDPVNCGACGHDCLGGSCVLGFCGTTDLAGGYPGAVRMALDDTRVYWTSPFDGTIDAVLKGGGVPVVLAANVASPFGVDVDAARVYFTSEGTLAGSFLDGQVLSVPLGATADAGIAPTAIAIGRHRPHDLRVDAGNVYWLDLGTSTDAGTSSDGAALRCPLAGCGAGPTLLAGGLSVPFQMTIDATTFFMTLIGDNAVAAVPLDGGAKATLATDMQQPSGLTVDGLNVYWASHYGPTIDSVAKDGSSPATLITVMGFPEMVAVDATNVYFTDTRPDPAGGAIMRCPLAGCGAAAPLPIISPMETAVDLRVDDKYLYWITQDGRIKRVPK